MFYRFGNAIMLSNFFGGRGGGDTLGQMGKKGKHVFAYWSVQVDLKKPE